MALGKCVRLEQRGSCGTHGNVAFVVNTRKDRPIRVTVRKIQMATLESNRPNEVNGITPIPSRPAVRSSLAARPAVRFCNQSRRLDNPPSPAWIIQVFRFMNLSLRSAALESPGVAWHCIPAALGSRSLVLSSWTGARRALYAAHVDCAGGCSRPRVGTGLIRGCNHSQ